MLNKLLFEEDKCKKPHILITFLYFIFHIFVLLRHEHWFDEAQAWVLVKNLSFSEVIRILPTEGHPALWFVFLMPFAKLGLSFYYASYISLIIMTLAVYLYLENAPFSLIIKCGTLLSSMFLFFNPVVVRSYSLIALIIVLLACLYKDRTNKPILYGILVSLLFQSHVVAFGLAIGLTIDLIIEFIKNRNNKELLLSIGIIIISFILMILEIMPRSDLPSGIDTSVSGILGNLKPSVMIQSLTYFAYTALGMPKNAGIVSLSPYILLSICVILIFVFISLNKAWKQNYQIIIIAVCGVGEFFAVLLLVYTPHTQMASILVMILLFVMWQLYQNNRDIKIKWVTITTLAMISFFTFAVTQSVMRQDIIGDFSASKKAAEIIETQLNENGVLIMDNNDDDVTVYAYVNSNRKDIEYYDAKNDRDFTIHQLGIVYDEINLDHVLKIADGKLDMAKDVLYLSSVDRDNDRLVLLFKSGNSICNEKYYIYRIER